MFLSDFYENDKLGSMVSLDSLQRDFDYLVPGGVQACKLALEHLAWQSVILTTAGHKVTGACLCMYVYVCVYIYIYIHVCVCIRVCRCMSLSTYIHIHRHNITQLTQYSYEKHRILSEPTAITARAFRSLTPSSYSV